MKSLNVGLIKSSLTCVTAVTIISLAACGGEASDTTASQEGIEGIEVTTQAVLAGPVPPALIVTHNGLEWVYASPCSGGCSQPSPSFQVGWRFATAAELAGRPSWEAFAPNGLLQPCTYPQCLCAAPYFDPIRVHCDMLQAAQGLVTSEYNAAGFWESWYVRDIAPPGDPDSDGDGVIDSKDNCVDVANPDQLDLDFDGAGNVCDPDDDGDGVNDGADQCPVETAPEELDANRDGCLDSLFDMCGVVEGMSLSSGLTQSFCSKIDAVARAASRGSVSIAENILDALVNELVAQTGKGLTSAQAAILLAFAENTRAAL